MNVPSFFFDFVTFIFYSFICLLGRTDIAALTLTVGLAEMATEDGLAS